MGDCSFTPAEQPIMPMLPTRLRVRRSFHARNKQATDRFFFCEEEDTMTKETSDKAAKSASKVLKDGRTGKHSKTAAGSALSQKEK